MSLQFIIGNAGSGKSTLLYQQIIQESLRRPSQKFLVIVPEQFTMQTQKEFVRLHPSHAIMNIDILSFERLAYRVFDELGTDTLTVLEETGKNLLLRRVARERGDELKVLGRNMKKKGYISEIKSLISELSQYHISPDDFLAMADGAGMSASFRSKAEDILVMYRGFLEAIAGRYITAEELPELLTRVVDQSRLVKGSVMAFDGFTGFTPIQNQLLRKLLTLAERTMVTVTCDVDDEGRPFICVQDTGIGIPEDEQAKIFERFYRVDKSRSKARGGTGLGLAIVKHAATFHRATIVLKSELDRGTTITVTFPVQAWTIEDGLPVA